MRTEKYLNLLRQAYFNLKSLKFFYFVPIIVLFVLLPILSISLIQQYGYTFITYFGTYIHFQVFIPFMGTWWVILALREYAEGAGRELLYVYKKSAVPDLIIIFVWYMLHVLLLFSLYSLFFYNYFIEFFLILAQTIIFVSVSFFLMFMLKTISIPFLINIIYTVFCLFSNSSALKFINILAEDSINNFSDLVIPYVPLVIASILLVYWANKKRHNKVV